MVAPTSEKAKEIMRYYIQHLGDNRMFFKQLDAKSRLDRLKQEESKLRIVLNNGGGIYTLSVDQRNYSKSIVESSRVIPLIFCVVEIAR